jgi:hypothetical protein
LVAILQDLPSSEIACETLNRLSRRKVRDSRMAPEAHFVVIDRARLLRLDDVVRRRAGVDCMVRCTDDRAVIEFGSNSVAGPAAIEPALRFIVANEEFRVRDLPACLADTSKVILIRRLVEEGLLTIEVQQGEPEHGEHEREHKLREKREASGGAPWS